MTQTAIAAQVHQALDVHLNFTTQVTFDGEVCIDVLADGQNFGVGQFVDATVRFNAYGFADRFGRSVSDTGDICEGDRYPLCSRDVYAGNTCHVSLSFFVAVP